MLVGRARVQLRFVVATVAAAVAVALVASAPALAKPKKSSKRRGKPETLAVVVLPFVGKNTGGVDAKDAVELELELVDNVTVTAGETVENDVKNAFGKNPLEPQKLASILAKRNVDVLIRGERGPGEKAADALLVTAYAKDGQPRFIKELALGTEPDAAAKSIVDDLKPSLEGWKNLKPLKLAKPGDDDDAPRSKIRAEDVLADDDKPKASPKKPDKSTVIARSSSKSVLDDDDDDTSAKKPSAADKAERTERADKKANVSPLDFNADPADAPHKSKHSRLDDDAPKETRIARTEIDDMGRKHEVVDDTSDTVDKPEQPAKLGHTFAVSGAFDGSTWYYGFDGGGVGDTQVNAAFYPGGSALLDAWPLSFAGINWVGVDGELGIAVVPFKFPGGQITPSEFTSIQTRAELALKLRYTLKNGIGLGVRAGYRYYGASVEAQTINENGQTQNLTLVPGYTLHAAAIGAELFLPILIGNHRLELEVRADGLPLTYYDEKPDNPGATTLAFGWAASLAGRYDIASGFFIEARGQSTGAQVTYQQKGSRFALVGAQLKQLQGGSVLNFTAGFSAGVGFMF